MHLSLSSIAYHGSHVYILHPALVAPGTAPSQSVHVVPGQDVAWRVFDPVARARDGGCMHASARLATGLQKFGSKWWVVGGALPCMYLSARAPKDLNFPEHLPMFVWKAAIKVNSPQHPVHSELMGAALHHSAQVSGGMALHASHPPSI